MADTITVLTSKGPVLAKRWTVSGIQPYDRAKVFSTHEVELHSIKALSALLSNLERMPKSCVIRGQFIGEDADATTRDLEHFREVPRQWVCLDVDGHDAGPDWLSSPVNAIDRFISEHLPPEFRDTSYHYQLSNSAGAPGKEHLMKVHLWFWLDKPRGQDELERWARSTGAPVDLTVFRTVQVHYTAAPVIEPGMTCPVAVRSGFVKGDLDDVVPLTVPASLLAPAAARPATPSRSGMVDPREKKGIIGAFCRAYPPVRAVSELLTGHFEFEGDDDRRLTWLGGGGSAGGAVITDDGQHVYNGHNTDPCKGRAVNSWDLCRVHLFGDRDAHLDEDALVWMGPAGTPSHAEMVQFAQGLDDVAEEVVAGELERDKARAVDEELERKKRLAHLETVRQGVLKCGDAEALKAYIKGMIVPDKVIDDADRNGALTIAVQSRFSDLGSPQPRDDVRKMLRPAISLASAGGTAPPWLDRWVYVTKEDRFFDRDRKVRVASRSFDAMHTDKMNVRLGSANVRESASDWAIHVWGIRTVDYTLYAPGEDEVFMNNKMFIANEFDPDTVPKATLNKVNHACCSNVMFG